MPPDFEEQLQLLLHRYADPVRPTRDTFAAIKERLRVSSDLNCDEDDMEGYAFILEDTLEETMANGYGPRDQQPSTTARSPRWSERTRSVDPRTTAIAGIAAVLVLALIATAVYAQFAARRTPSPAATKTSGPLTKIAVPNSNALYAWTTAPDGSFWYANSSHSAEIGHVTPDANIITLTIPTDNAVKGLSIFGMAVGSDGNLWFSGAEERGTTFTPFIRRMTPEGAFTMIPVSANLTIGRLIAGPDGALWFGGANAIESDSSNYRSVIGRITMDGQITTFPTLSQDKDGGAHDLCVGPDNAIWYAWISSLNEPAKFTGRIGRVSSSGQVKEFTVPYAPGSIASGSDGALWYSELAYSTSGDRVGTLATLKGSIGRISDAGVASELPIDPNTRIAQLVAGSDGAIWYTMDGDQTGAFGRIAPSGTVKTFSTHGNARIALMAAVPGALWLFDDRNNLWHYRLQMA
jgi:virginiamycin B lyase